MSGDTFGRAIRRLQQWIRFRANAEDLQHELAFHRERIEEELTARGLSPADARAEARRRMGNETLTREDARGVWLWPAVEDVYRDVRIALRGLARNPGFTVVATLTIALGVGANAAVFSVVSAVMLRPLPFAEPDRVVMVWDRDRESGKLLGVTPADFTDWRAGDHGFTALAALDPFPSLTLTDGGVPERFAAAAVSADIFAVLGVRPALGRAFVASDETYGGDRIVMLSDRLWRARFGSDSAIVGRAITLNGTPYTVTGVLPPALGVVGRRADFDGHATFDVWIPLRLDPRLLPRLRGTHPLRVFARLGAEQTVSGAYREMDAVAASLEVIHPETNEDRGVAVVPLSDQMTSEVRGPLLILAGAAALVLAIACANVVALLLGRATVRMHEFAVRIALGAGRARLARQLVTEGLVLSTLGSVAGVLVAWTMMGVMRRFMPADLAAAHDVTIDARVLSVSVLVAVATGVLFGVVPLMASRRADTNRALRAGTRATGNGIAQRLSVIGQLALALTLLAGAGLTTKSLWRLLAVDPGFEAQRLLTARISLAGDRRYETSGAAEDFYRELVGQVGAMPGADGAAVAAHLPLGGTDNFWSYEVEGARTEESGSAKYRPVGAGYFETVRIPLRDGRTFTDADRAGGALVVVINESLARVITAAEGGSSIGRRLRMLDPTMEWRTVVGVVADVRHVALDRPTMPELYLPLGQAPFAVRDAFLTVRTRGEPTLLVSAMRDAITAFSPDKAVFDVQAMEQRVAASADTARFRAALLGVFALLALSIATVGVFGVMAYIVGQRTREMGVRLALGATPGALIVHVMRGAAGTIASGLVLGLAGAWALGRVLAGVLFEVTAFDGAVVAGVAVLLATTALAAAWVPARRVTRVSPVIALRGD